MSDYTLTWRGDEVERDVLTAVNTALDELAGEADQMIRGLTPVRTGFLRDSTHVDVWMGDDGVTPTITMAQDADYAIFVELGTRFMRGHFQITQTMAATMPLLADSISNVMATMGYGIGKTTSTNLPEAPGEIPE